MVEGSIYTMETENPYKSGIFPNPVAPQYRFTNIPL